MVDILHPQKVELPITLVNSADTEVKNLLQEQRDLGVLPFHANQDIENLDHSNMLRNS